MTQNLGRLPVLPILPLKTNLPFVGRFIQHDAPKRLRVKLFVSTLHPHSIHISTPIRFQSLDQAGSPNLTRGERWFFLVGMKCLLSCQRVFFWGPKSSAVRKKNIQEQKSTWPVKIRQNEHLQKDLGCWFPRCSIFTMILQEKISNLTHIARAAPTPRVLVPGKGVMIETAVFSATQGSSHFLSADSHEKHGVAFAAMGSTAWSLAEFLDWHQVRDCQECDFFPGEPGSCAKAKNKYFMESCIMISE